MEIKGFLTNLGKYNEGELVGRWVTFPIDEDEQNEIFESLGLCHYDEEGEYVSTPYEEYFFTDWDGGFGLGEYESIERVNELAEALEGWDDDLLEAVTEVWGLDEVLTHSPDDYNLYSDVRTDFDLGYYWLEESGCYDLEKLGNLAYYIDYEKFGRDIRFESNGGFCSRGWVEYVG